MRKLKMMLTIVALATTTLAVQSCKDKKSENSVITEHEHEEQQGKEYTSAYVCPMHCAGSGSETEGTCPVCEMTYVKNENDHSDNK